MNNRWSKTVQLPEQMLWEAGDFFDIQFDSLAWHQPHSGDLHPVEVLGKGLHDYGSLAKHQAKGSTPYHSGLHIHLQPLHLPLSLTPRQAMHRIQKLHARYEINCWKEEDLCFMAQNAATSSTRRRITAIPAHKV